MGSLEFYLKYKVRHTHIYHNYLLTFLKVSCRYYDPLDYLFIFRITHNDQIQEFNTNTLLLSNSPF